MSTVISYEDYIKNNKKSDITKAVNEYNELWAKVDYAETKKAAKQAQSAIKTAIKDEQTKLGVKTPTLAPLATTNNTGVLDSNTGRLKLQSAYDTNQQNMANYTEQIKKNNELTQSSPVINKLNDISQEVRNQELLSKYNYDVAKEANHDINLWDKTGGVVTRAVNDFFNPEKLDSSNYYTVDGNRMVLPTASAIRQQNVSASYDDSTLGGKIAKMANDSGYNLTKIGLSSLINSIMPYGGSALYYADMASDSFNQAKLDGYDDKSSALFSIVGVVTEMATEHFLGGLSKYIGLSKGNSDLSQGINRVLGKILKNDRLRSIISNGISEGGEEFLQEFIEKFNRNLILDKNSILDSAKNTINWETFDDAVYSAMVGAISGGFMGAVDVEINTNNTGVIPTLQKNGNLDVKTYVDNLEKAKANTKNQTKINNINQVLENLNVPNSANNYSTFANKLERSNIDGQNFIQQINNDNTNDLTFTNNMDYDLQEVGINNPTIKINRETINKVLNDNISQNVIEQIPRAINMPSYIIKNGNNFDIISTINDNGQVYSSKIEIDSKGNVIDININPETIDYLKSNIYPYINESENNGNLVYDIATGVKNVLPRSNQQNVLPRAKQQENERLQYAQTSDSKVNNVYNTASKYFDNSQESRNLVDTVAKIAKDKGYNIVFDDTNMGNKNGFVTTNDNGEVSITLNPYSPRALEFVLVHEITHAIETKSLREMVLKYAQDYAKDTNQEIEYQNAIESLKKNYKESQINSEIIADISGQMLGNQEFINRLSVEKPNIFKRMYNEIKAWYHKMRGWKSQNEFLEDLMNKWEIAYATQQNNLKNTEYSIENIADFDSIEYNNIKQEILPKNEFANLATIINSDPNVTPGVNILWNIYDYNTKQYKDYEIYYKSPGEFKVINSSLSEGDVNARYSKNDGAGDEITRSNRISNKVGSEMAQETTANRTNDDISNINQGETYINRESNTRNRQNIGELDNSSFSFDDEGRKLSKQQQNYFKNSKVRDSDGKLKTLYHGTPNYDFYEFMGGTFLTDDYWNADGYASGERIIESYVNMENPLVVDCKGAKWDNIDSEYGSTTQEIASNLDESKYDGVIFENVNDAWYDDENGDVGTVYYVPNSNQIKETDNTKPTSKADIRYSKNTDEWNNYLEKNYRGSHQIENAKSITELDLNDIENKVTEVNGYLSKQDTSDLRKLKKILNNPNETVKIYRASPVNELNSGDWVTTDKAYAQNVADNNGGRVYSYEVKANELYYPDDVKELPSLHRLSSFQYVENKNNNLKGNDVLKTNQRTVTNDLNEYIADAAARQEQQNIADRQAIREMIEDYIEENDIKNPTLEQLQNSMDDYNMFDNMEDMSELQKAEKLYKEVAKEIYDEKYAKQTSTVDSQGRKLSKQQQEYFKDSKVRDDNGNLLEVYHGTNYDFTVFKNPNRNNNDYESGKLFADTNIAMFTSSNEVAQSYIDSEETPNKKPMSVYLNIKNPYIVDAQYQNNTYFYDNDGSPTNVNNLVKKIHDSGKYDGVIIKNVADIGSYYDYDITDGKQYATDYITFNSNQIKNVNNTNPTTNEDIRYSKNNQSWQQYLEDNFKASGTRTYSRNILANDNVKGQEINHYAINKAMDNTNLKGDEILQNNDIYQKLSNEVDNAIKNKNSNSRLYLGKVTQKLANKIKNILGIDTLGRKHVLTDNDIRHMLKEHGNQNIESRKGQLAITDNDIKLIPEIITNYDNVIKGTDNKLGQTIRYIKKYNDNTTYVVEVVPDNSNALIIKTMWKKPSTLTNSNAPSLTSKTKGSDISSTFDESISQNNKNVNLDTSNLKGDNVLRTTKKSVQETKGTPISNEVRLLSENQKYNRNNGLSELNDMTQYVDSNNHIFAIPDDVALDVIEKTNIDANMIGDLESILKNARETTINGDNIEVKCDYSDNSTIDIKATKQGNTYVIDDIKKVANNQSNTRTQQATQNETQNNDFMSFKEAAQESLKQIKQNYKETVDTATDLKESKFYKNATETSKFINEENRNKLGQVGDIKYYEGVTNEESLTKAAKKLQDGGEREAISWLNKDAKVSDSVDVAEGWILLENYQQQGNYDAMVEVAKKMREMGTKAGQAVQAYNIMARLTPEGMVKYAQSQLGEAYEIFAKNKSQSWIDQNASKFDLTPQEVGFIVDTMNQIQNMEDGRAKNVKLAEINKMLTDKLPPERGSAIKAWMRNAMLLNPKTQIRNILGNAVITPVNMVGDYFASKVDKAIAKKTGVRTTGTTDAKSYLKGFKKGLFESYDDFRRGINTRDVKGNRFEIGQGKSFNDNTKIGKALNKVDALNSFLLDFGDRGFYEAAFTNSINNQLALNNKTTVTQDMIDIAEAEALQRTWQDNNNYTKFVLQTRNGLNKINVKGYGLGDVLIPFAKTPANLTKAIVDYSPAGLVKTLIEGKNLKNNISTGKNTAFEQHQFVQDLGKATAGTMLYVAAYALAKAGIATGKSDDDKDTRDFIKNTLGVNSYSIKIGNKSFTYDWAQPVAAPLSIMTNIVNSKNNKGQALLEAVTSSLDSAGSILLEQSFLKSINEVLTDNDGIVSGIENAILDLPARAVPTFMKQIVDLTDGTQRQTFEYGQPLKTAGNKIIAKIPGLEKTLTPSVDSMGREIQKYGGKNNIFNVFLNPANVNTENISKGAEEIYRVYKQTGDKTIMPRVAPYYINSKGEKTILNTEQRKDYQKVSGKIIEDSMQELLNNKNYKEMSDEQKSDTINNIVNYSYNKAKQQVLGMELTGYKSLENWLNNGGTVASYYANKEEADYSVSSPAKYAALQGMKIDYYDYKEYQQKVNQIKDEYSGTANANIRKQKVFDYINNLNLSKNKKIILFKMLGNYSIKSYSNDIYNYINGFELTAKEKQEIWNTLF